MTNAGCSSTTKTNGRPQSKWSVFSGVRIEHLIAGISGGVTSTLILHPLDLMKIRFAVSDTTTGGQVVSRPHYHGLRHAMGQVLQQEGVKGLYRGVAPNMWGAGTAWGLYFLFYNTIKTWFQKGDTSIHIGPTLHMVAAAQAGVLTLVATNPIWVVKTRLCLQYEGHSSNNSLRYRGMMDALVKTYKLEGFSGLYKGFVPGIFGVSHGALQFMAYEELKARYNDYRSLPNDTKLSTLEYLSFAALSKLFAAVTTYPYQVVRTRMQDQHSHYKSVRHCIAHTWRVNGVSGFYKGLYPNLLRVVPATAITFVVYEHMTNFLQHTKIEDNSNNSTSKDK